jgi:hypothetical protein
MLISVPFSTTGSLADSTAFPPHARPAPAAQTAIATKKFRVVFTFLS